MPTASRAASGSGFRDGCGEFRWQASRTRAQAAARACPGRSSAAAVDIESDCRQGEFQEVRERESRLIERSCCLLVVVVGRGQ